MMYFNEWLLVVFFTMGDIFSNAQTTKDTYLGPPISKPFHFPWLVSFHLARTRTGPWEFFGSGSMLTSKWVLASMDTFIKRSGGSDQDPYYMHIKQIYVTLGYIYADGYKEGLRIPSWMEVRKIESIRFFADPEKSYIMSLTTSEIPYNLNSANKSSFGFSMAIAIVELKAFLEGSHASVEWRRTILPIPLHFGRGESGPVEDSLSKEFKILEEEPFGLRCHAGGWRVMDRRLVVYEVVYVPFEQCESIYCSYDPRVCLEWPIKGIHVCFKSLTFTDLCWRDQGTALFCEQLSGSVVAILTTAPTCGYNGLPGVFTLINHGLQLLESTAEKIYWYKAIPKSELLSKYGPKREKDLFPAY